MRNRNPITDRRSTVLIFSANIGRSVTANKHNGRNAIAKKFNDRKGRAKKFNVRKGRAKICGDPNRSNGCRNNRNCRVRCRRPGNLHPYNRNLRPYSIRPYNRHHKAGRTRRVRNGLHVNVSRCSERNRNRPRGRKAEARHLNPDPAPSSARARGRIAARSVVVTGGRDAAKTSQSAPAKTAAACRPAAGRVQNAVRELNQDLPTAAVAGAIE
jgi:hypothetical protein